MASTDTSAKVQFLLGLGVGLAPTGLAMIGISINLWLGGIILLSAFILIAHAFWVWVKWNIAPRLVVIVLAFCGFFYLVMPQISAEYRVRQQQASKPKTPLIASPLTPADVTRLTFRPEPRHIEPFHESYGIRVRVSEEIAPNQLKVELREIEELSGYMRQYLPAAVHWDARGSSEAYVELFKFNIQQLIDDSENDPAGPIIEIVGDNRPPTMIIGSGEARIIWNRLALKTYTFIVRATYRGQPFEAHVLAKYTLGANKKYGGYDMQINR